MLTQDLVNLLTLEKLEDGLYRGQSQNIVGKRVFGGQVLGQALRAASYTADRPAHSLHAYFLYGGDIHAPIVYQVDKVRDGRSFLSRNVNAIQHGRVIFQAMVSFATPEAGLNFQIDPPDYPAADSLPNEEALKQQLIKFIPENIRQTLLRKRHLELTPVYPTNPFDPQPEPAQHASYIRTWDKLTSPESEDIALHQAIVAFASDFGLMMTGLRPHGLSLFSPTIQCASIDHTIYFHHPVRADEWFLHDMHATQTASSRGLNFGRIWQNGQLVASTIQEGLMRVHELGMN